MRALPLRQKAYTILDDNGNGMVYTGPASSGEWWENVIAAVSVMPGNTDMTDYYTDSYDADYGALAPLDSEATCLIYSGAAATQGYFIDSTTWGSTGDSSTNISKVLQGGNVFAVWSNGNPGARAALSVTGTKYVN
jgi:hypothetical protein